MSALRPPAWCLPVEVDLGVIAVLGLAGVAPGECAEEGVGQQTGDLLLRQRQGVVHPRLQQGDRLKTQEYKRTYGIRIHITRSERQTHGDEVGTVL